jgi:hypothetical protein
VERRGDNIGDERQVHLDCEVKRRYGQENTDDESDYSKCEEHEGHDDRRTDWRSHQHE